MNSKVARIVGWVLSVLLAVFLIGVSGVPKFIDFPGKKEMFEKMGFTVDLMFAIGVLEVALAVLFLLPRVGFLAAIMLTGYLGGAVVTHLRVGDAFFFPIIIGVFMWVALGLRQPTIFRLAVGAQPEGEPLLSREGQTTG
jgi:hypothetical protein